MNQTIYFRKDIWSKFEKEEKKSELINHLLAEHYDDVAVERVIKELPPGADLFDFDEDLPSSVTVCKHGSSPQFCKHSKPGKPCK